MYDILYNVGNHKEGTKMSQEEIDDFEFEQVCDLVLDKYHWLVDKTARKFKDTFEKESDISTAFDLQERTHASGKMMLAATSCRMVSFRTFESELERNNLDIKEKGITSSMPDFDSLMYAVVKQ